MSRLAADVATTWKVLLHPRATFAGLRDRHPVLAPWLVGSLLSIVLTLLVVSVTQRAAAHMLAQTGSPEMAEQMSANLQRMKLVSVVGAPLGLVARWGLTALLLWAPAVLLTTSVTYRAVLSVVAYSALPGIFGRGLDLAVTWFQGPEFTTGLSPALSSTTSLGALFPTVQAVWPAAVLEHLTVFGLWGLALWVIGLREKLGLGWGRSFAVSTPAWTLLLVLTAAMDVLGRSALGSLPGAG